MTQPWVDQDKLVSIAQDLAGVPSESPSITERWRTTYLLPNSEFEPQERRAAKMARKHAMPVALRGQLWLRLSGGHRLLQSDKLLYVRAHTGCFGVGPHEAIPDIDEKPVPRFGCLSNVHRLCLTDEGIVELKRVLFCLRYEHSEALYCPFLPVVVAACLHWMNAESAFATAMALLREPSPFPETRLDTWLMLNAFSELARKYEEDAYDALCQQLECPFPPPLDTHHPLSGAALLWVSNHLPFWSLMRLIDNFIVEGEKVFYRFNLAILHCWYASSPYVRKQLEMNPRTGRRGTEPVPMRSFSKAMLAAQNSDTTLMAPNNGDKTLSAARERSVSFVMGSIESDDEEEDAAADAGYSNSASDDAHAPPRTCITLGGAEDGEGESESGVDTQDDGHRSDESSTDIDAEADGMPAELWTSATTRSDQLALLAMSTTSLAKLEAEAKAAEMRQASHGREPLTRIRSYSGSDLSLAPFRDSTHQFVESTVYQGQGGLYLPATAARLVGCPDRLVQLAYSYKFSRDHIARSDRKGYRLAREAMMEHGVALGVEEPRPTSRKRRGDTYGAIKFSPMPTLVGTSDIASKDDWMELWRDIPIRYHMKRLYKLFDTSTHGYSLATFYSRCSNEAPTLLMVRTDQGHSFGAFLTFAWSSRTRTEGYFGNGETFVFSLKPCKCYVWAGLTKDYEGDEPPSQFMHGSMNQLSIGGGPRGSAITLDAAFSKGFSFPSPTYNNPSLVPKGEQSFNISRLEVWAFQESH